MRCMACGKFQSRLVTKAQKYSCAVCGTKQAIQRIFAISTSAKDIRLHVQELNMGSGLAQAAEEARSHARASAHASPACTLPQPWLAGWLAGSGTRPARCACTAC